MSVLPHDLTGVTLERVNGVLVYRRPGTRYADVAFNGVPVEWHCLEDSVEWHCLKGSVETGTSIKTREPIPFHILTPHTLCKTSGVPMCDKDTDQHDDDATDWIIVRCENGRVLAIGTTPLDRFITMMENLEDEDDLAIAGERNLPDDDDDDDDYICYSGEYDKYGDRKHKSFCRCSECVEKRQYEADYTRYVLWRQKQKIIQEKEKEKHKPRTTGRFHVLLSV
jgi:hypothetical protein